ncbi:MAG: arsenite efflux MFS transporter ArsK [Pseudochelatococcus sp.]|jgi:hypothetical protein|uniref:arsenite efflux MFS transporter ArsK n=1 Tax=Pseudochelatococcus sp. TaxID=2020869 RepID=UPI003D9289DD
MNSLTMITALGIAQVIGYGTLYHSFALLAPAMAQGLGWPVEGVFGVLSAALLASGLLAPRAGRWADSIGAGRVMAIGTLASAAALTSCALLPGRAAFVATVTAIEIAAILIQYNTSFSFLVQLDPRSAQRNITYLTLFAGLASTIFWPITTSLHAVLSWRQVYLVFAASHLVICLPLYIWLLAWARRFRAGGGCAEAPRETRPEPGPDRIDGQLAPEHRATASALMIAGFAFQSFVLSALLIHMLPLLYAIGLQSSAVAIGMLVGPAQLLSRTGSMVLGGRLSQSTLAIVSAGLMSGSLLILLALMPHIGGAVAFAVVFGLGAGLSSIVQGTLPLVLFGSTGYAARAGQITSAKLIVSSASPLIFSLLMERAGVAWTLAASAAVGGASVFMFIAIMRLLRLQAPAR